MIKTVHSSMVMGTIIAPSSKSLTQRAIAAALLANGTTVISNPSFCNDSKAAIEMAKQLGASVVSGENYIKVTGSKKTKYAVTLNCGESGLALRMFSPIASLLSSKCSFTGEGSLVKRPVTMITDALSKLGVEAKSNEGFLPLVLDGHLKGGRIEIDGSLSSQLLTGLLMALPIADHSSEIIVNNLKSKPYIDLTIQLLKDFGITIENHDYKRFVVPGAQAYKPRDYSVEGDWSGAAFILVAGAVAGEAKVNNLFANSRQADVAILDALKRAGANINIEASFVKTIKSELKSFDFDATECPDLFPPLACMAIYCKGTSRIKGVGRLEHKESNRAFTIMSVLIALGIKVSISEDEMIIEGGELAGATISSHNDHRIAMMASIAALGSRSQITITEAEAISKSYPEFFIHLEELGAEVK
jgi:3-phosphoshikimate 1-carboxyvinyltransferase